MPSPWQPARAARRALYLCLAVGLAAGGAGPPQADPRRGEARAAACAVCHGPSGAEPLPKMPSLAGQPQEFLALQLTLLREGLRSVPEMEPLLKGMSDRDIGDIAAYFAGQAPARAEVHRNGELYARGAELAKRMHCDSCHRSDFKGQRQMPRLAGQREDYLVESMKAFRDNARAGTDTSMAEVLYGAPDADIRALAHFLAQQ